MIEEMAHDFQGAIEEIRHDADVKVLVVTGAGRGFCAGADFSLLPRWIKAEPGLLEKELFTFYRSFLRIRNLSIPTIAALNGAAIGAGACLAAACDLRLAAREAQIGFSFIKLGLNPGMGAEFLLTRLVGPALTMELLMTGDPVDAEKALRIGLVNKVVASEELMRDTLELANRIADMPALPLKALKQLTHDAWCCDLEEILSRQAACQAICYQHDNVREGIKALQEKRRPRFGEE
jgi:enoyl-CoA hydratase